MRFINGFPGFRSRIPLLAATLALFAGALHAQGPAQVPTAPDENSTAPADATVLHPVLEAGPGPAPQEQDSRYVLALVALNAPVYPGAGRSESKLRPAFSFKLGRWRFSTSRSADLGGLQARGAGASTVLRQTGTWQTALSLRVNSGRSAGDDPLLAGMPDLSRSLEGRLSVSRKLGENWAFSAALTQDLTHPAYGARLGAALAWSAPIAPAWRARASLGLEAANGGYMRTHFGVRPQDAIVGQRAAYDPGAGLLSASAGAGLQYQLARNWLVTGAVNHIRLLGQAASSPLTVKTGYFTAMVGLAYVSTSR